MPIRADAELPLKIPQPDPFGNTYLKSGLYGEKHLTLIPELQLGLSRYLKNHGSPIAGVVLLEVETGNLLSVVQGRDPSKWMSSVHTALFTDLPAASIFKVVSTIAAMETLGMEPSQFLKLSGACSRVHPRGAWLKNSMKRYRKVSLQKAFAQSCNSFFAKLAVEHLGLSTIKHYAHSMGWGIPIPADFKIPESPFLPPKAQSTAAHVVGKFSAGFGQVGMSLMHAAWLFLSLAKDGYSVPLRLFTQSKPQPGSRIFSTQVGSKMDEMMHKTVTSGTARTVFRKRRYRNLRAHAGGKTGTLSTKFPKGQVTWFAGSYPYYKPEVVVAAVVVNKNYWVIKGPQLAAEALKQWKIYKDQRRKALSFIQP